jgi:hypothetical protein
VSGVDHSVLDLKLVECVVYLMGGELFAPCHQGVSEPAPAKIGLKVKTSKSLIWIRIRLDPGRFVRIRIRTFRIYVNVFEWINVFIKFSNFWWFLILVAKFFFIIFF